MPAKRLIWLGCIILTAVVARCAELNCSVEINADRIPTTAREVFTTLQQAMAEYLNTTSFTEAQFSSNEKLARLFYDSGIYMLLHYLNDPGNHCYPLCRNFLYVIRR